MATKQAPEIITKTAAMEKNIEVDFSGDCAGAETISTITDISSSPVGLTFSNQAVAGQTVTCRVTGGSEGTTYYIDVRAVSSLSQILDGRGKMILKAIGT